MICILKNIKNISINSTKACNTDKVCNNIVVNDITSSQSTYENTTEVKKKYESNKEQYNNDTITWKYGTCLVVGDSMLRQIDETRMSRKFNLRVRSFPRAKISDMYHYLIPILNKKPDYIVLHVGTDDAVDAEASVIVD